MNKTYWVAIVIIVAIILFVFLSAETVGQKKPVPTGLPDNLAISQELGGK